MMHELIIEGQHVDLSPDTSITLEYSSNLFGKVGEVKLSHSYTVKLPRTVRNARILDRPEAPAHAASTTRRYLSARYYRNGIDLIGAASAYVLSANPDEYEVALLWGAVPELSAWSASGAKLPDLTGLPTVSWKGASPVTSAATASTFFALYDSGAWSNAPNIAPHPCVTLHELLRLIFNKAGISFTLGDKFAKAAKEHVLLVAPSHKPSFMQERASGSVATVLAYVGALGRWWFTSWTTGWDAPYEGYTSGSASAAIQKGTTSDLRIILNVKNTGTTKIDEMHLELSHGGQTYTIPSTPTGDGGFLIDTVVNLEDALQMDNENDYFTIYVAGPSDQGSYGYSFSAYDSSKPLFALIRPHETINTSKSNLFSVSDNLPDIGQYDFVKSLLALFGAAMIIKDGKVLIESYDAILQHEGAYDWTDKVDMDGGDGIQDISYSLDGFAQVNAIRWEEDVPQTVDPDILLTVDDQTLSESSDLLKLPFAASIGGQAKQYKCRNGHDSDGKLIVEVTEIDIKPRIFGYYHTSGGTRCLTFPETLRAEGAVAAYMQSYQAAIRKPVTLSVNIRLHELDLASLDFTKAVYLRQYGKYYAILKVQTSETDLCKVELLQLP